jgi:hypothetical protein
MSLAVLLPLLLSLGISLVPILLLRRQDFASAQDRFVSPGYTPPEVIRNSSIAHALRLAVLCPFFALGVVGDFWPVIIGASCLGLGIYLAFMLRPSTFILNALAVDRSITVHAFIARQHGCDPNVRVLAASLTLFSLVSLMACEAFALAGFLKLTFGNEIAARLITVVALLLALLYAIPAGHFGTMHTAQFQLGMIHLGLFGTAALLLYMHLSEVTPLPPNGAFAVVFVAGCCLVMLFYRRSRYVDAGAIDAGWGAKALSKFAKIFNPIISVFAVLIVVLALMEFYGAGISAIASAAAAALEARTNMPAIGLIALALLPLFYPLIDVAHWQRLAAAEKNEEAYQGDTAAWLAVMRRTFRIYAVESPLLWLFVASLGALAAVAIGVPGDTNVMQALLAELASGDNPVVTLAFSLLLVVVFAIALSTMSAAFSAGVCTIRYDILPTGRKAGAASNIAARIFFLAVVVGLGVIDTLLPLSFTSSSFLALVFALATPPLAFVPLILGSIINRRAEIGSGWAFLILGIGTASMAGGILAYAMTGNDAWLWAAAPVCLVLSSLLYAIGTQGSRIR